MYQNEMKQGAKITFDNEINQRNEDGEDIQF